MSAQELRNSTPFYGTNAVYIAEIYEKYLQNPSSVDKSWQEYFSNVGDNIANINKDFGGASWAKENSKILGAIDQEALSQTAKKGYQGGVKGGAEHQQESDSIRAHMLIRAYRVRGHLLANLDPLGISHTESHPELEIERYGFSDADLDREIFIGGWLGLESATLRQIIGVLQETYCRNVALEFIHIQSLECKEWLENKMESTRARPSLSMEEKDEILQELVEVVGFEEFLHKKYPGTKRFSAEGGENLITALNATVKTSAKLGVSEVVIGMPHRGRLNVLTAFMGKPYVAMLSEFQGNLATPDYINSSGDVKYHLGFSSDRDFDGKGVHLSLTPNPSHLEIVNPVVQGKVRAKQDQMLDKKRSKAMGILLHGDAAFCGQGVVPEALAMNDLEGYKTGGTVHIIVNNQVGFTTNPSSGHTSPYPTDVAMMIQAPIFHVNGDDPEAVWHASQIAAEYRDTFKKDVILDIWCYRKYGHNEGDEPRFTQPLMYEKVAKKKTPRDIYAETLIAENVVDQQKFEKKKADFIGILDEAFAGSNNYKPEKADMLEGKWQGIEVAPADKKKIETGLPLQKLKEIGQKLCSYPDGFEIHKGVKRMLGAKQKMIETGDNIDWATGEALAFAGLLLEGSNVRLSGQDCMRGTFSHRHSGLVHQKTEEVFYPLNNLTEDQKTHYEVINSHLSEFAVLAYEYGYSSAEPNTLCLWEAQFGDFANGAQVVFDQFISSAEVKWLRMSGLVVLLPHGYEGQGPEHSSARIERFLQSCAEDNLIVANCTTPANYFHILRRQLKRKYRKPLIIFSPKSLLRHKKAVSSFDDMKEGTTFKRVLPEINKKLTKDGDIRKLVICSGKVYYDLLESREEKNINDVAIIRLEQYYPYPEKSLLAEIEKYKNAEVIWCQEEPENMGAWSFLDRKLEATIQKAGIKAKRAFYVGRKEGAATACGYMRIHVKEQKEIMDKAFS